MKISKKKLNIIFLNLRVKDEKCKDTWNHLGEICFKIFEQEENWYEARNFCKQQNSDLATLNEINKFNTLQALFVKSSKSLNAKAWVSV